jgi:hypothetical protein
MQDGRSGVASSGGPTSTRQKNTQNMFFKKLERIANMVASDCRHVQKPVSKTHNSTQLKTECKQNSKTENIEMLTCPTPFGSPYHPTPNYFHPAIKHKTHKW